MKVTLKLFAGLSRHLPPETRKTNCLDLDLEPGATVQGLIAGCRIPPGQCALVLVNGAFIPPLDRKTRILAEGDVVAIWPPVGGG